MTTRRAARLVFVLATIEGEGADESVVVPEDGVPRQNGVLGQIAPDLTQRFTTTDAAESVLNESRGVAPTRGAYWSDEIVGFGADAVLEVEEEFRKIRDVDALRHNVLSEVSDRIALALRRRMLLATLRATKWNLSHTAERLRLGDVSGVVREIKRVGLSAEHAAARKRAAHRTGHKARVPDEKG